MSTHGLLDHFIVVGLNTTTRKRKTMQTSLAIFLGLLATGLGTRLRLDNRQDIF
jgi:hypothetical protein